MTAGAGAADPTLALNNLPEPDPQNVAAFQQAMDGAEVQMGLPLEAGDVVNAESVGRRRMDEDEMHVGLDAIDALFESLSPEDVIRIKKEASEWELREAYTGKVSELASQGLDSVTQGE